MRPERVTKWPTISLLEDEDGDNIGDDLPIKNIVGISSWISSFLVPFFRVDKHFL
jgi:hypothetical protein